MFKTTIAAAALAAAVALPAAAQNTQFTAVDLYQLCNASMEAGVDAGTRLRNGTACRNILGQAWERGVNAGQICRAEPINNMQIAIVYMANLWKLPAEYLTQRADAAAAATLAATFPCR